VRIKKYSISKKPRGRFGYGVIILLIVGLVAGGVYEVSHYYQINLKPVSNIEKVQIVTIKPGSSVRVIAKLLQDKKLIKNALVFEEYVNNQNTKSDLQAGTYALSPSWSVQEIAKILSQGRTATSLVAILPDRRIAQVRADLINSGFSQQSVDDALDPAQYKDLPVFVFNPNVTNLEGLLYPDSFQKNADTDPSVIIRESLIEMGKKLDSTIQAGFAQEGLSVYQGLTLSSIVEREVSKPSDQTQVAQVFLSRIKQGMKLESNVTANYGAIIANQPPSIAYDSPYNTYLHVGLPPTPISTVDVQALDSTANPSSTDWLYFVTGKDGITRFSHTIGDL
jgi:UPF0755 protein